MGTTIMDIVDNLNVSYFLKLSFYLSIFFRRNALYILLVISNTYVWKLNVNALIYIFVNANWVYLEIII